MFAQYKYAVDAVCRFTNRGISGVISNDGRLCRIASRKPLEQWAQGEPEYIIRFLDKQGYDTDDGFGARECELEEITDTTNLPGVCYRRQR